MLDYRGAAQGPSFPVSFPDALARLIHNAGGDRFDLGQSWCVHRSGALLLDFGRDGILFDASATRYGMLAGGACRVQPRYYEPYWHQIDAGTRINCKKDDCAHRFDRTSNRYIFSFAASIVEISPIKIHCLDAHLLRVVIKALGANID
jgi:hypothetical protein